MEEDKEQEFEDNNEEDAIDVSSTIETGGKAEISPEEQASLEKNLARVEFSLPVVKDIVSPHTGSILARDGPVVPLSEKMLDKARSIFDQFVPPEEEVAEAGEGDEELTGDNKVEAKERRMKYSDLAAALFACGVTPIDVSNLEDDQQESEHENEDGTRDVITIPNPLRPIFDRLIATFSEDNDLGPSQSLNIEGFLSFVSRFQAPPFHYGQRLRRAAGRGCTSDVIDLLIRGTDVNTADGEGLTSLHYAAEFNRSRLISEIASFSGERLLVNAKCKAGWTPLYAGCHHNNVEVVSLLLSLNANVGLATMYGKSPLHAAAGQGFVDITQVLLDAGADSNQKCTAGMTPLHDAAYKGQLPCYELLCKHDSVDASIKENLKYTAEQLLHSTTGTNTGGPMSYGGSTIAAQSAIDEGMGGHSSISDGDVEREGDEEGGGEEGGGEEEEQ